jgi:hypothetical protein
MKSHKYMDSRRLWSSDLEWMDVGVEKLKHKFAPPRNWKAKLSINGDPGQIDEMGTIWFHKKKDSIRYTLLLALLVMKPAKTKALFRSHLKLDNKNENKLDFVTIFDNQHPKATDKLPYAVIKRHGDKIAFYLVDVHGIPVQGSDVIWINDA